MPEDRGDPDAILTELRRMHADDPACDDNKRRGPLMPADPDYESLGDFLFQAHAPFFWANALSSAAFPSLKKFESEVLSIMIDLLGGDDRVVGNLTTGAAESIQMAVKTARQSARKNRPEIKSPQMVLPVSAHPAFLQAAHYFGIKHIRVPLNDNFTVDPGAMDAVINDNTIFIGASAPTTPHGIMDPIGEIGSIALKKNIHFHVDAGAAGLVLPIARRNGYDFENFDFCVPGVSSLSLDLNLYGFAPGSTGVVLYRNKEIRKHQFFVYADWPGGVYGSPTMTGSRAGGPLAATWAAFQHLAESGYADIIGRVLGAVESLKNAIKEQPDWHMPGNSVGPILALHVIKSGVAESETLFIKTEAIFKKAGLAPRRLRNPDCLQVMVTPAMATAMQQSLEILKQY